MVSGPLLFLGIGLESSHEFRGSPHKGQSLYGTVGSPFYIAPEVVAGGYNQVADVWNAGVILYILLSGMPLFWGKTKSQIFDAVRVVDLCFPPDQWDCVFASAKALISGMLCMDPAKRLTAVQVLGIRALGRSIFGVFAGENHDFWSIKMRTYLLSQDLWDVLNTGLTIPDDASTQSTQQQEQLKENKQKDEKALYCIQQVVADTIFPRIMGATTAKDAWNNLMEQFQGNAKGLVKKKELVLIWTLMRMTYLMSKSSKVM
ncbi:uncharacterized protein LOC143877038 isoform X2 [Tasmannia lanceolata]|uniref:uncharacterized protein LOC143877038 isoform X2 n=1 Tax=Tasmannia lanceolata TaxID=3420 RepID=UPI00406353A8